MLIRVAQHVAAATLLVRQVDEGERNLTATNTSAHGLDQRDVARELLGPRDGARGSAGHAVRRGWRSAKLGA